MSAGGGNADLLAPLDGRFELVSSTSQLRYAENARPLLPAGSLYLVRHGETFINRRSDVEGWANSGLDEAANQMTPEGRHQAVEGSMRVLRALERHRGSNGFIFVFTSELRRARETASPLIAGMRQRHWQFRLISDSDLNEINLGLWNNRLISELPGQSTAMRRFRFGADAQLQPPGGESFVAFLARTQSALRRIINDAGSCPVVVVTHSTVITAIRMLALDKTLVDARGMLRWTGRGIGPAESLYWDTGLPGFSLLK